MLLYENGSSLSYAGMANLCKAALNAVFSDVIITVCINVPIYAATYCCFYSYICSLLKGQSYETLLQVIFHSCVMSSMDY